jgi:transposase InsO family protein
MNVFDPRTLSPEALFRYQVVSQVVALRLGGENRGRAVEIVASRDHLDLAGKPRPVTVRTLYRWLADYKAHGAEGLVVAPRPPSLDPEAVPPKLIDFIRDQKKDDPRASLPELIDRARRLGILPHGARLDRVTLYRRLKSLGIPLGRRKKSPERDMRRFAYPHRMQMVLCDGKHFRAGAQRLKRVALFFLDDATRLGLHAVVGPSESARLFQQGLYETLRLHDLMDLLYLDHGPGFISNDTLEVVRRLGIHLIHGTAAYPEGHGKIEKFNQFALSRLLRNLDHRPEIDPDFGALALRLQHFLRTGYNLSPHESLGKRTPLERFQGDSRPLRLSPSDEDLRGHFVLHLRRRVSADHIVSVDSMPYELPRGRSGEIVTLQRKLLEDTLWLLDEGRLLQLHPVDLAANARNRRARPGPDAPSETDHPLPPTAADLAFQQDLFPVVDPDGGFSPPPLHEEDLP